MEIKLNAGDKINIPTGCFATIIENTIVIEEKQEEFKDGDILVSKSTNRKIYLIFSNYGDGGRIFTSHFNSIDESNFAWVESNFRHATEEEKKKFFNELWVKGLWWNPVTKVMKRIRKRARWEKYIFINSMGELNETIDMGDNIDDNRWAAGNYYLLSETEQAEEDAKAVKAIYEKKLNNE